MSDGGAVMRDSAKTSAKIASAASLEALAEAIATGSSKNLFTDKDWPEADDPRRADRVAEIAATFRGDPRGIRIVGAVQYTGIATVELPPTEVSYNWKVGYWVAECAYLLDATRMPGGKVIARVQICPSLPRR